MRAMILSSLPISKRIFLCSRNWRHVL